MLSPIHCLAAHHDDVVDLGDDRAVTLPSPTTCCGACELCTAEAHEALASTDFVDWSDARTREAMAHREATEGAFDLFVDTLSGDLTLDAALPCELAFDAAVGS